MLSSSANAQTTAAQAATTDTSYIDAQGTAHITRIVPVPATVSAEARKMLARPEPDAIAHTTTTLQQQRASTDEWQQRAGDAYRKVYPVNIVESTMAGVKVRIVTPLSIAAPKKDRVLIDLHGGGFESDSGSLTETIPIANLSGTKVVAVLYRLSPENKFPAALDDAIAVYKDLLKTHRSRDIAIYGTSSGAVLAVETAAQLKKLGLPQPGALGIFSGTGNINDDGDSASLFSLHGLSGHLDPPAPDTGTEYIGNTDPKDPVLSPLYSDLRGMPPTLFLTSTRDFLLSGTTLLHRAFLRAGDDAQLIVFEALPHAFWNDVDLPESREADQFIADFFDRHLGK